MFEVPLLAATLVLADARVVQVATGEITPGASIVVRDGLIESISTSAGIPPGAEVLDLEGKYVVPGLIDVHSHVTSIRAAREALHSGITTLRILGVHHFEDIGLRELRRAKVIEAPEIFAAGYHIGPGPSRGPGDEPPDVLFLDAPEVADLMGGIRGPESYRRITAVNLERGVDWIKTTATARAGRPDTDPREQLMSQQELAAVVESAAGAGVGVAAHAHDDEGGLAAVLAGVRSLEHGTYLSQATLKAMRERGVTLVPTLSAVEDLASPGGNYAHPFLEVRGRHMLPRVREVVRSAHEIGVPIATGTDSGFEPESTIRLQHEIEALTACGRESCGRASKRTSSPSREILSRARASSRTCSSW